MTQNLSDYNIGGDDPQTILLVGDSGAGKSIAACSWPGPIYMGNCDGRVGSIAEWHRGRTDIDFDFFTNFKDLNEKVDSFEHSCPYKTVICPDPITMVSDYLMRYSFSLRGVTEYNEETGKVEKGSKGRKKGVVDMTTAEDFGVEHRGLSDLIINLKVAQKIHKFNIIVCAHLVTTTYVKMGGTESHIRRDILTAGRKIAAFLPIHFDEIYHCYTEDGQWLIKTYNDGIVAARSSFLNMPKTINWTEKSLYDQVSKYYIPSEKKNVES